MSMHEAVYRARAIVTTATVKMSKRPGLAKAESEKQQDGED